MKILKETSTTCANEFFCFKNFNCPISEIYFLFDETKLYSRRCGILIHSQHINNYWTKQN